MDVGKNEQHSWLCHVILYVLVIRQNLVLIDIKYHDLSYKITQQQKALSVSELLGKWMRDVYLLLINI